MSANALPPDHNLTNIELFHSLTAKQLQPLAKICHWKRYLARQQILMADDGSTDVFFIVSGLVRATLFSSGGKEVSFQDLGSGQTFGELSAIDAKPRSTHVVALAHALIASMPAEHFLQTMLSQPSRHDGDLKTYH